MNVRLILVPYDSAHRGERMGAGPERLVQAGLADALEEIGSTVETEVLELPVDAWRAEIASAFQLAGLISRAVSGAREKGSFPIVLAGNCMSTLGTVAGLHQEASVLWFDAHGDFNTPETTMGGFLDGMGLSALTGRCWTEIVRRVPGFHPVAESRVFLIGARDIDPLEAQELARSKVHRLDAAAVDATLPELVRRGIAADLPLHVHLDLDVTEPTDGRANQFATPDGVPAARLIEASEAMGEKLTPASLTVSSYDPSYDADGRVAQTAIHAVKMLVRGRAAALAS